MDWTKYYPILGKYDKIVNVERYSLEISKLVDEVKVKYSLSTRDSMLVIKDILYKDFLRRMEEEKKSKRINNKCEDK